MKKAENIVFCIDKKDKDFYEFLEDKKILTGKNKDLFLFTMGYGYKYGTRVELENRDSSGYWRWSHLNMEEKSLLYSLILEEKSNLIFDDNQDINNMVEIAEEYAHSGVILLQNLKDNTQMDNFGLRIEQRIFKVLNKEIIG